MRTNPQNTDGGRKYGTLGIYGGTFSPPHAGHLHAMAAFLREFTLDALYAVPANLPPHKPVVSGVAPADRLEMLRLAVDGAPELKGRVAVSDWEIAQSGKSYTVLTLEHFKSEADDLVFLMGTDMLMTFHQWYRPREICSLARIAFINRENEPPESARKIEKQIDFLRSEYGADVTTLSAAALPMSSEGVRRSLSAGEKPDGLDPKVYEYIKERHLYGL